MPISYLLKEKAVRIFEPHGLFQRHKKTVGPSGDGPTVLYTHYVISPRQAHLLIGVAPPPAA